MKKTAKLPRLLRHPMNGTFPESIEDITHREIQANIFSSTDFQGDSCEHAANIRHV